LNYITITLKTSEPIIISGGELMLEFRGFKIATIDDIEVSGKKVLLRVDINSPVDRHGKVIDISRIVEATKTIRELAERKAAVVIMSHQGRPLDNDFISLEQHSRILSNLLGFEIKFVDDIFGPEARRAIASLKPGETLLLENTRICSEDIIEAEPEKHVKSMIVTKLSHFFDFYVNDAFSACHRSQATLVGFPMVLPSAVGRVMEMEISALSKPFREEVKKVIFIVGGAKIQDAIRMIRGVLNREGSEVLVTGLVAQFFLYVKGLNLPKQVLNRILEKVSQRDIAEARSIIEEFEGRIHMPVDFIVDEGNIKVEPAVETLTNSPMDIGPETVEVYGDIMRGADIVVIRGPAGVVEDPRFRRGTAMLIEKAVNNARFVIIGGGHLLTVMNELPQDIRSKIGHVSTAGGALLELFARGTLPCIEALIKSYNKFKHVYLR